MYFLYGYSDGNGMVASIREGWLEDAVKNEVTRLIIIAVFSTLYELEKRMTGEGTKAGMLRAKAEGSRIGHLYRPNDREAGMPVRLYREGSDNKADR